ESDPPGHDFLATLAADWEAAAVPAGELGVRVARPRIGVVLGRGGGALPPLALPFRLFLGGHVGSGRQWVSWVHLDDVVGRSELADTLLTGQHVIPTVAQQQGYSFRHPALIPALQDALTA